VSEVDVTIHVDKICQILDEVIIGGMVQETTMTEILDVYATLKEGEARDNTILSAKVGIEKYFGDILSRQM
jgi:hypothetical protein